MSAPTSRFLAILAAVTLAAAGLVLDGRTVSAWQAVGLDDDDIGGVVTSPNGPEAGVWVIAETDDFPTRLRKIVVTDDEGRYVLPDLPDANYEIWVRGYGLADSPKVAGTTRADARSDRGASRLNRAGGRRRLPGQLLVRADAGARPVGVPGHGRGRQRHTADRADAGPLGRSPQAGLPALPPARQPADPGDPERCGLRLDRGGLGAPDRHGPTGLQHGRHHQPLRAPARDCLLRGVDRPDHGGRGAFAAGTAPGPRARRRADHVGVGRRDRLHPRRDRQRQARSPGQRRRSGLRRRVRRRQAGLGGPDQQRGARGFAARTRHPRRGRLPVVHRPRRCRTRPSTTGTS